VGLTLAATEAQEHGGVDDRDTFLHRVRDLLNIHTGMLSLFPNLQSGNVKFFCVQLLSVSSLLHWIRVVKLISPSSMLCR
jgi:hypothetical protein